jgi:penicillin-binding protein 2
VARWFSAIANGGSLPRPSLVRETGLIGEARTQVNAPEMTPTGLQPEVIETIQSGLCAVPLPGGTADFVFRNSELLGVTLCGKTGTAQTGGPDTPSDAWFASYAPRENPQVVVVVLVQTAGQGSEIAAPIARQILEVFFGLA